VRAYRTGTTFGSIEAGSCHVSALVMAHRSTFSVDAFTPLFGHCRRERQGSSYDVSADGQRLLVNSPVDESTPITLLINWLLLSR
jgi:hypothetical protein